MAELTADLGAWVKANVNAAKDIPAFFDARPEEPDTLITFNDTGGFGKGKGSGIKDHRRTIQVVTRDPDRLTGRELVWAVYNGICDQPGALEANGRKMSVTPLQNPTFLDTDASGRSMFVFNLVVITGPDS